MKCLTSAVVLTFLLASSAVAYQESKLEEKPSGDPDRNFLNQYYELEFNVEGDPPGVPFRALVQDFVVDPSTPLILPTKLGSGAILWNVSQERNQKTDQPKFWIGVSCQPVTGALQSQLKLEEGQGLLVEQVLEDAPALKAGVKVYDIFMSVNGQKLTGIEVLIEAVQTAKGEQPIKLELIREGEKQTIEVTPVERKQEVSDAKDQFNEAMLLWMQADQEHAYPKNEADRILMNKYHKHLNGYSVIRPGVVVRNRDQYQRFILGHAPKPRWVPADQIINLGTSRITVPGQVLYQRQVINTFSHESIDQRLNRLEKKLDQVLKALEKNEPDQEQGNAPSEKSGK